MRCTPVEGVSEGIPSTPSKPKPMLKKSFWSRPEDEKLINYMLKNGNLGGWSYVAKQAGLLRCGKSCRLRWINYLRPGLKRGPFSYQEERLIIRLQSIFGNRWSLIAAQLPGRTDNELKNYWKSCIKKKLKLEHHLSYSSSSKSNVTDTKSQIPRQCNSDSVSNIHGHDVLTSSQSSQKYLDVIPEGSQPPDKAFNVVNSGENLLCVPGVMELKHKPVQDQSDHEFSIDPDLTNGQQISYPNLWTNASSINNIDESFCSPAAFISPSLHAKSSTCDQLLIESCTSTTVEPHEAPCFPDISLGSTGIEIPSLLESASWKGKLENDENHITIDHSNATDSSDIVDSGAYTSHEGEVSILEKYGNLYENNTQQSYPPLNLYSQFSWPACEFREILSAEDCRDGLNWSYAVNLGIPTYTDISSKFIPTYTDISSKFKGYLLPTIDETMQANPFHTILGQQGTNGLFETECQGGAPTHDDM